MRKTLFGLSLSLLLLLALAACGGVDVQTSTPEPVVVTLAQPTAGLATIATPISPSPTDMVVPSAALPSVTTAPPLPGSTPAPPLPSDTVAPSPPSPAPAPVQGSGTPSPVSPSPPPTSVGSQAADPAAALVQLERVVDGLDVPVGIAHAGDGSERLFIVEKTGRIRVVAGGSLLDVPFLDIVDRVGSSQSEQGLLGLAFHPDYVVNGLFYVNYTDKQGDTVVSRFQVGADPGQADPASERVLLTLDQPAANHNGGHLAFGPNGYLYVGTGDGGGAGDRFGNGQNGGTLLGAMLRLDIDGSQPYAIPAGNPFVDDPSVRDEIWAIGLRNPWRYSFDRLTGDLYLADVGQNQYEEVNFQAVESPGGLNYGWPIMEGLHCYPESRVCDTAGLALPIAEYDHGQGCSVTGGYVYRGQAFPVLNGLYLFGDYCSGRIWGLAPSGDGEWRMAELAQGDVRISSFGEDERGELYLVDVGQGALYRITGRSR